MELIEILQALNACHGPSGSEGAVAGVLRTLAAPYVDSCTTDALGNLICPNNTVAACATVGEVGNENKVMRKTLKAFVVILVEYMVLAMLYTLVLFPNFGM